MEKVKYHPILFSTPMVQAIMENRKTQTRRIVKLPKYHPSRTEKQHDVMTIKDWNLYDGNNELIGKLKCPYNVGDVFWVRETFHKIHDAETDEFLRFGYKADKDWIGAKWIPSLFMPKEACRNYLKIKSIRVERLQDISEEDAIAEGAKDRLRHSDLKVLEGLKDWVIPSPFLQHQFGFLAIWCTINGCDNWISNPFVWVYEFEKIEKPLDFRV